VPERCRAPQNGCTPLHVAAGKGHAAVVEKLLAAGAATHATDEVRREGGCGTRIGADRGATCTYAYHVCLRSCDMSR